jgi:polysaccharide pyruvyl transferase WcaK-like protein
MPKCVWLKRVGRNIGEVKVKEYAMLNLSEDATIGVFGHFGNRNLGDEATIEAVIQNIELRVPNAVIVGFSTDPDDTKARFNIQTYPIWHQRSLSGSRRPSFIAQHEVISETCSPNGGATIGHTSQNWIEWAKSCAKKIPLSQMVIAVARMLIRAVPTLITESRFLGSSYKILKDVDLLMITGSNQLLDNFGGPWGFPYTLLKWSAIAKLAGTKVSYVCVGAGPIRSRLSMAMIRLALTLSDYSSFRDMRSQELIETIGVKGATAVYPDLAYSLYRAYKPIESRRGGQHNKKPTVGINPMPVYDHRYWYINDADKYASYVKILAKFSAALLRKNYPLVFWATQPKDQNVIADVLACLELEVEEDVDVNKLTSIACSTHNLLDVIDSFDIVVATRFHGIVLSLSAGKAVMSLCYHNKMDDLMKDMGQSEYSVMFDALNAEDLLKRFKQLEQNTDYEVEKIKLKVAEYRKALARQYDRLFGAPVQM